jgi:hypothetical protein
MQKYTATLSRLVPHRHLHAPGARPQPAVRGCAMSGQLVSQQADQLTDRRATIRSFLTSPTSPLLPLISPMRLSMQSMTRSARSMARSIETTWGDL